MKSAKRAVLFTMVLLMVMSLLSGVVTASSASNVTFTFSNSGIETSGAGTGYSISGTALTISESGTYLLTGSCTDGTVEVKKNLTVTLVLDNLTLTSATTAPFIFGATTNVTIETVGTNTLRDTVGANADGSVIKSKNTSTLTLIGSGTLNLYGNDKNGIKGAADTQVIVNGLTLNIEAAGNALSSDGAVIINEGSLNLISGNDAIKSEPDILTDSTGMVTINGGDITVVSAGDGIQASSIAAIYGGTFHFTTGAGYKVTLGAEDSAKSIKSDTAVLITGGIFYLNCADDSIHSTNVTVEGGDFTIYSGDDALHADYILTIGALGTNEPSIDILACYEGFEGAEIYLYSGTGSIIASDDGINTAGSDLVGYAFRLSVYDGYWYVNSGGDSIDSNGNIYLYGGTIESFGSASNNDAALDFDGKCYAEGGTILAVGTSGMAQNPSSGVYVTFGISTSGEKNHGVQAIPETRVCLSVLHQAAPLR